MSASSKQEPTAYAKLSERPLQQLVFSYFSLVITPSPPSTILCMYTRPRSQYRPSSALVACPRVGRYADICIYCIKPLSLLPLTNQTIAAPES